MEDSGLRVGLLIETEGITGHAKKRICYKTKIALHGHLRGQKIGIGGGVGVGGVGVVLNLSTHLPVSEHLLAFVSFSPRITDLPTCLCDARRQVACTDLSAMICCENIVSVLATMDQAGKRR